MNELIINKERIAEVYKNASFETRETLKTLFGEESNFIKLKPTLDDYTTIKTYEDACEALGVVPMSNQSDYELTDNNGNIVWFPPHIIALMKLETIGRALWGRAWEPKPDAEGSEWFYYPTFILYTQQEIGDMDKNERKGLLSVGADSQITVGFGCLDTESYTSYENVGFGFRLAQENSKKALYFGKQFIELWAEYLKYNFVIKGKYE